MASARWLSDDELLAREFTTADPASIEGLSFDSPPEGEPMVFLMEYHLGLDEPSIRCCACVRKAEHWNGFVVQVGDNKHLIGSVCGPKHFGLEFRQGGNALKDAAKRQRQLRRALELPDRSEVLLGYYPSADPLGLVLEVERALSSVAPKLYRELRQLVNRGDAFSVTEEVRDFERELRTKSDKPLFQNVRSSIGPVRGGGLLCADTLSRTFSARRRSLAVLFNALGDNTNDVGDRKLASLLDRIEADNTKATQAVEALNDAAGFFAADNLQRLEKWAATVKVEPFRIEDGRIGFPHPWMRETNWIGAPKPPKLPAPPPLFE